MDTELKIQLEQYLKSGSDGSYGQRVQESFEEYESFDEWNKSAIKYINDLFKPNPSELEQNIIDYTFILCKSFIATYLETKKKDKEIAHSFLKSLFFDFPGIDESKLFSKWQSLTEASFAFQAVAHSNNYNLVWQQSKTLTRAYQEFINGLFGFLIICWRCINGKTLNKNVFKNTYGSKMEELYKLTDGDEGIFAQIFHICNPKLRNAIAHDNIWNNPEAEKIVYKSVGQNVYRGEIDISKFLLFASLGTRLGQSYFASICAVLLMEEGKENEIEQLPSQLVGMFYKKIKNS
ncbi:hypothetical protein J7L68_05130 [bacterium]|nr:hypothetical protein [bacterium]